MVHTLPDYTTKYKMTKIFGNIDTGELAARLGSIDTFDRRGNVLWLDDFNSPTLKWLDQSNFAGAVTLSIRYPYMGAQSAYFQTDDTAWNYSEIKRYFAYPLNDRLGFEFWFALLEDTTYVEIQLGIDDGIKQRLWKHKIDVANNTLEVYHNGVFVVYETLPNDILASRWCYNSFKLVVDMQTLHYVRSLFNNVEYDLSGYIPLSGLTLGNYFVDCRITVRTTTAAAANMYLDNFIYTFNEP